MTSSNSTTKPDAANYQDRQCNPEITAQCLAAKLPAIKIKFPICELFVIFAC